MAAAGERVLSRTRQDGRGHTVSVREDTAGVRGRRSDQEGTVPAENWDCGGAGGRRGGRRNGRKAGESQAGETIHGWRQRGPVGFDRGMGRRGGHGVGGPAAVRRTTASSSTMAGSTAAAGFSGWARTKESSAGGSAHGRQHLRQNQQNGDERLHERGGYFFSAGFFFAAASLILSMYLEGSFLKSFSQDLQQSFTSCPS